jgi:hypothetical protein
MFMLIRKNLDNGFSILQEQPVYPEKNDTGSIREN